MSDSIREFPYHSKCENHSGIQAQIDGLKEVSDLRDIENESALQNLKEVMERNEQQNKDHFDKIEETLSKLPDTICDKIDKRIDEKIKANNNAMLVKLWGKIIAGSATIMGLFMAVLKIIEHFSGG